MVIQFPFFCPLSLAAKLNFSISKKVYCDHFDAFSLVSNQIFIQVKERGKKVSTKKRSYMRCKEL